MGKGVFYLIIAGMVAVMGTFMSTDSLHKGAAQFNALTDVSIVTDYKLVSQPTPGDNISAYAINEVAAGSIPIALEDPRVKDLVDYARANKAAMTIAAVQPTVYEFRDDGNLAHSSSGMLVITVNYQSIDSKPYLQPSSFDVLQGRVGESHQQVWNVMVDLDKETVTDILETPERVMMQTLEPNTIFTGMNMFLPNAARIEPGTTMKWVNTSPLPHNIVGVYKTVEGQWIPIDSGFMQKGGSWKYTFGEEGVLEYRCTTHSEDGMSASLVISN